MFAAYVFTIIDSQDMQERNRPRACCRNSRRRDLFDYVAHRFGPIDGVRAAHTAPSSAPPSERRNVIRQTAIDSRARQAPGPFGLLDLWYRTGLVLPSRRTAVLAARAHRPVLTAWMSPAMLRVAESSSG
jgi:hypothetical protein